MDGRINFRAGVDTAEFESGMSRMANRAKQTSSGIKTAFAGLGGLIVGGGLLAGLRSITSEMDRVAKLATRFGATAVEIQKIGVSAELAGTNVEVVARAMTRLSVEAAKAVREGGELAEKFNRVGISAEDFVKASLTERLQMLARAQRDAGTDGQALAEVLELVGVRAADVNFSEIVRGMGDVSAVSDETVRALERANDQLTTWGNNVKWFFGEIVLGSINRVSESIGNQVAGQGFFTNAEVDERSARADAMNRLAMRDELLPDDTRRRRGRNKSRLGPNAEENELRIAAELTRMAEERAAATQDIATHTETASEAAGDKLELQRQLRQLALEIAEAEAAGNEALAADLREYETLIKAAVLHEGDLELAARAVNAEYEKRRRQMDENLAKQQKAIESELEYAEAMAFGTDEQRKRAEWMRAYNSAKDRGADESQAQRAANAAVAGRSTSGVSFGGGGMSSSAPAPLTASERIAQMRAGAAQSPSIQRANAQAARGMFGAATMSEARANRAAERIMDNQAAKDFATDMFGGSNMGEAYRNYRDMMTRGGEMADMSQSEFEQWARDQGKTEAEKQQEESERDGSRAKKTADDPMKQITGKLDTVIKHMEERLPIRVLAA